MGDNFDGATPYPRHWLITAARTASNMVMTILNLEQQNVIPLRHGGYFFFPAVWKGLPHLYKAPIETWTEEERAELDAINKEIFGRIQDHIKASESAGKVIFVKEHALFMTDPRIESQFLYGEGAENKTDSVSSRHEDLSVLEWRGSSQGTRSKHNLTVFPDEFLHTITPTFLIRHPAVMIPSNFRAARDQAKLDIFQRPGSTAGEPSIIESTMRWNRALFDFYTDYFASIGRPAPMVLDADDVMTSGSTLMPKYARAVGLDPAKIRFAWDKGTGDDGKLLPIERRMLSTLLDSSNVDKSKIAGQDLDIDAEAVKWRDEFGEESGRKLEGWVRDAMPHYLHMRAKKMLPDEVEDN